MALRPLYSTARPDEVARLVAATYAVGAVAACVLVNRGFNDVYEVTAEDGARFVLRISNRRAREAHNLDYETAVLAHLDRCGVPVAAPIKDSVGRYWSSAALTESERPVALFHHLEGRLARAGSAPDAFAQGRTLGEVHQAGCDYAGPASRQDLDAQHLIDEPVRALLGLPTLETADRDFFRALTGRLVDRLDAVKGGLARALCHGDCHGRNARIVETGPLDRRAAFFDFDDGGPGWVSYDLAVYLWQKVLNPDTLNLWPPFLQGYQSVRPVDAGDLDATLLFVAIRHVWLLGEYATRAEEWGLDNLSSVWVARQVAFLRDWEDRHLAVRLF